MKRESNEEPLKVVIDKLLKAYRLESKLDEIDIVKSWGIVMGDTIANRTKKIYLHKKVLYVKLDSSVLRNELSMAKTKVMELLNKDLGKVVVEDVKFN